MDIRKVYLLILLCTFCILSPVYTQQPFSDEFRKRQEIMLLFTPVRQRKIITSRSILTIPIGIRMNFARGLSVMADGFTRICSSVMIPIKRV